MAIGLTEEHEALAASVRGFAERNITSQVVREGGEGVLAGLAAQGLPGLHLPEDAGGQGFGILEQAVALEELGRALVPGPYTPTVLASAVLHASGASKLPAGLADGSPHGGGGAVRPPRTGRLHRLRDGGTGARRPLADVFVLPAGERWVVLERDEVTVGSLESLDVTRPVGSVTVDGSPSRTSRSWTPTCGPSPPSFWAPRRAASRLGAGRRRRLRQDARAVRPPDRPVPGRQAQVRPHARRRSSAPAPPSGTRPARSTAGGPAAPTPRRRRGARRPTPPCLRRRTHPGARRHRLHLRARRPPATTAGP